MIKWHKPSEKMPEYRDDIVCYNSSAKYIFKTTLNWHEIRGKKIICSAGVFDYWAYASDFNFPKEENE